MMRAAAAIDQLDAVRTARHHPAALLQRLAQELILVLAPPAVGIPAASDQAHRQPAARAAQELDSGHFQTLYDGGRAPAGCGLEYSGNLAKNTCILEGWTCPSQV